MSSSVKSRFQVLIVVIVISSIFLMLQAFSAISTQPLKKELELNASNIKVLFDESHRPLYGINGTNPTQSLSNGFHEFAESLINNSYIVETLDDGNSYTTELLEEYAVLVIGCSQEAYTTQEISIIYNWVVAGGNLFLTGEWDGVSEKVNEIAVEFNYEFAQDLLKDTDEFEGQTQDVVYNESNIRPHEITTGVTVVKTHSSDGLIRTPTGAEQIIVTDNDGTATWDNGSIANEIPIMSVSSLWNETTGKIVVLTDTSMLLGDGTIPGFDYLYYGNKQLILNTFNWLAPIPNPTPTATTPGPGNPLEPYVIAIIAGSAGLLLVVVISFIIIARKKK